MESQPHVIEMENVYADYGGPTVLEDINLTIHEGDFVGVVGPNGGGKTTLLKVVLGLVRPARGEVRVFGQSPRKARNMIGYVPQQTDLDRDFPVSVLDVVLMGRLGVAPTLGPFRKSDRQVAFNALAEVDADQIRDRRFGALSGGQQKRVLIARALACRPRLLILDEPLANLDTRVQPEIYTLLKRLNQDITVVLVSHDIGVVTANVTRVVCVNRHMVVHPTSEITDQILLGIYGGDMRLVRHDHHCVGEHEA